MSWSLRRSLQISSMLIGCAISTLAGADDGAVPQPAIPLSPAPAQPPAAEATPEAESAEEPLTREALTELIGEKRYADALQRLNAAAAAKPDDTTLGLMYMLLSGAVGNDASDEGLAMLRQLVDSGLEGDAPLGQAKALGVATALDRLVTRDQELTADAKLELLKRLDQKLPNDQPRLAGAKRSLLLRRITTLFSADRQDEAQAALEELVRTPREQADPADSRSVREFVEAVNTYQLVGGRHFPERLDELTQEAEQLTTEAMAREEIDLAAVMAYYSLRQTRAAALARSNPEAAAKLIDELEATLESARERLDENSHTALATYTRSLQSLRARIDAALKIAAMVGTEAPEIDAESFIACDPVSMQDLRGKVVLIDFWAVWCGPCIQTFPHLIQWHEKYADRGLVILGATRHYGYRWDDEAGRAVRAPEVTPEEELVMLEKFREAHKLRHGFFVTPSDSTYQADFSVTGIPHAVLIDQEGKIQMVRIGSGEANAQDLEEKIEQLLGSQS